METARSLTYAVYLVLSAAMTVWVARTLFKHGRAFLVDALRGNSELADSINHLLVVGFYLVNLGYVSLMLKSYAPVTGLAGELELLSVKLGWVLLVLGGMHFMNLYLLSRLRRSSALERLLPPLDPSRAKP
jgi:hypothetical protein